MVGREVRAHAAGFASLLGIAVGAIVGTIMAASAALAGEPTTRVDVTTALALEQGRRCAVARAQGPGGAGHVTVRGDACDGRRFIRAILALLSPADARAAPLDLDIDLGVRTLDGFNGESLHDVTLRLSVQRGEIAAFALAAKLGDSDINGGLGTAADHRPTIRLDAGDAGVFLRWTGLYRGVRGGALNVVMYAPSADGAVDDGVASLRAFTIMGDPALRPLAALFFGPRHAGHARLAFGRLRVAFKSQSGRVTFSEGRMVGELVGATLGGSLDLAQSRLDLQGVVMSLAQFSPMSPIFLPPDAGLFGSDYSISGSPSAPVLRLDPLRTLEPGLLRKLFEFKPDEKSLAP